MFESFATWELVLAHVASGGQTYYHAPLDVRPVLVGASRRGTRVRVTPNRNDADPFWADAGHLDRFRRRVGL